VAAVAGRLLCLETTLYAPEGSGPRVPLASANVSVPFNPEGEVRLPKLQYLITNAQLLALEQRRAGDLHLEVQIRGFLPQAASGFPGAPATTCGNGPLAGNSRLCGPFLVCPSVCHLVAL
jgi:hypothetical protein